MQVWTCPLDKIVNFILYLFAVPVGRIGGAKDTAWVVAIWQMR